MARHLGLDPISLFLKPKIRVPSGLREEAKRMIFSYQLSVVFSILLAGRMSVI